MRPFPLPSAPLPQPTPLPSRFAHQDLLDVLLLEFHLGHAGGGDGVHHGAEGGTPRHLAQHALDHGADLGDELLVKVVVSDEGAALELLVKLYSATPPGVAGAR